MLKTLSVVLYSCTFASVLRQAGFAFSVASSDFTLVILVPEPAAGIMGVYHQVWPFHMLFSVGQTSSPRACMVSTCPTEPSLRYNSLSQSVVAYK